MINNELHIFLTNADDYPEDIISKIKCRSPRWGGSFWLTEVGQGSLACEGTIISDHLDSALICVR